ncbi:SUMF1/EgtB/PvdO family nonheme iron enzyme, partial [Pirellulales bacterium]|nr:SUMF1/EgtB/PvdO family nonheme iron enzyme [Pirellulales bacterium]
VVAAVAARADADIFGSGANQFQIEFVPIGDPGNLADTTGDPNPAGAVDYIYRMGKYEISEQMIDKANAAGGMDLPHANLGPNQPATEINWFDAARFVNWLNEDQGAHPAYKFDDQGEFQLWEPGDQGYDPDNLFRNRLARYFLPSADEWYKAAFYDPALDEWFDYPNGMNSPPNPVASGTAPNTAVWDQPLAQGFADITLAGGSSPFGTFAQAGNVYEWEETEGDLLNDQPQGVRGFRGGNGSAGTLALSSSSRLAIRLPNSPGAVRGFRVASIPEPHTLWLSLFGASALMLRRRRESCPHYCFDS